MTPDNPYVAALFAVGAIILILLALVVMGLAALRYNRRENAKAKGPRWVNGFTGEPVAQSEEGKLFRKIAVEDTCPDCGGKGFYGGPEGGMSQNIFCKNVKCRSGFNVTPFGGDQGLCERIGKGDIERYPAEAFGVEHDKLADARAELKRAEEQLAKHRRFKIKGIVEKHSDAGVETLAEGEIVKEAESAEALKAAWEADMRRAFPMGPDYNVEYHCTVTPLDEDDDNDGDATLAATAAAVAATTMF